MSEACRGTSATGRAAKGRTREGAPGEGGGCLMIFLLSIFLHVVLFTCCGVSCVAVISCFCFFDDCPAALL